jgi:outer membrane receptor for ferrienterochelin and colicins
MPKSNATVYWFLLVRRAVRLGVSAAWLIAGADGLQAQATGGAIEGVVRSVSDSLPVLQATVQVTGTPLGVLTGEGGSFRIIRIDPGTYTLRVSAPGYEQTSHADVVVTEGESVRVVVYVRPSVIDVPGLVVTASRSRESPDESPVSVSVMDWHELEQRNVNNVGEALPFAQGVVSNGGQLDIRGASGISRGVGSRVLVLLDGHRMLKGVGSEADLEKLPLLDVERVEVVKGSHSSLYGTGALGGVVNVITAVPSETPETLVRAYVGAYDTPSRYRFTDETLSTAGIGVQHSRRISGVGTTLFLGTDGSEGFRQNGGYSRWQARVKTVFGPDTQRPVDAFVNWTQREADEFYTWLSEDQPLEVEPEELGDWLRETDLSVGATLRPLMTQKSSLQIRPIFDYNAVQNHFHDSDDSHRSSRLAADAQFDIAPSFGQAVTAGMEASWTEITSTILVVDPSIVDLGLYAQDEIRVSDRFRAVAGLRFDYHGATSAESDFVVSPRIGGVYLPSESVSLRASVSRGYRAPSAAEQYTETTQFGFDVIPNLELTGERAWSGEVGTTARVGRWLRLDAALFYSDFRDLIEPSPVAGQFFTFQFQNVAQARVFGLDTGAEVGLLGDKLGFKANYLYLDSNDERTGEPLPYRSPHNLTLTVSAFRELVAVDYLFRSEVEEVLAYPLDPRGPISVVDLRVTYRFGNWVVMGKIANVLQSEYVDIQERNPGASRMVRLTVMPRF